MIVSKFVFTLFEFDASRGGANANDPKTQYVHNLNETCKKFESLSSDVNARIAFYQDLQETFLAPMKQNVFDWAFARSEEAKIHVQSLGGVTNFPFILFQLLLITNGQQTTIFCASMNWKLS